MGESHYRVNGKQQVKECTMPSVGVVGAERMDGGLFLEADRRANQPAASAKRW